MTAKPPPSPRTDARANRDALIDAADRLIAQRGLPVPYEEIAREAGLGRATMYRHFPHVEDLLGAIHERTLDGLERAIELMPPGPERLGALLHSRLVERESRLPLLDQLRRASTPEQRAVYDRRLEAALAAPVEEAHAGGTLAPDVSVADVRVTLLMLAAVASTAAGPAADRADRMAAADFRRARALLARVVPT